MRIARYDALLSTAQRHGARAVATGHTLDDQAETVMLRLLRGVRLKGLGGMPTERPLGPGVALVRPMLGVRRAEVRRALVARGLSWLEDPTNGTPVYARNRLRLEGLPVEAEVLARVADAAREAWAVLSPRATTNGGVADLAQMPRAVRRIALERLAGGDLEESHLLALERLVEQTAGTAAVSLPEGRVMMRQYGQLRLSPLPTRGIDLTFSIVAPSTGRPPAGDAPEVWFDADVVRFPLTVRFRRPGDRIRPFGGAGRRKVQDVLVDAKVPRASRDRLPLVFEGDEVIWVPGVVRAVAAPVQSGTVRVLRIQR